MKLSAMSGTITLLGLALFVGCNSTRVEGRKTEKDTYPTRLARLEKQPNGIAPRTRKMLSLSFTKRQKLIKDGVLHDGMKLSKAWEILGPATTVFEAYLDEQPLRLHWYWNPEGRHVAPYFTATLKDGLLYDWKSDNR